MIVVRKSSLNDAASISRLCIEAWWETYADILPREEIEDITENWYSLEQVKNHIAPRERWDGWIVAEESGNVLGVAGAGMTSETETELFDLYVDIHCKRKGIGSKLLEEVTKKAKHKGAKEQWAAIIQNNMKGIPFYLAQGFVQRGERTYPDGSNPTLLFWREI
ncbi:MAG: GNAT family N-acetyltransferase [Trueperaceae bacterium]